jgi:hypothetical protein
VTESDLMSNGGAVITVERYTTVTVPRRAT